MDETIDVPSPNSLLDAEGDVDSSFGETSPEENTAQTQAADALCTMGGVNTGQANEHADPAVELCLPHTAASTTSQTGENANQAMDTTPAPVGPEASHAEANQALASTVAPGVSGPSPAATTVEDPGMPLGRLCLLECPNRPRPFVYSPIEAGKPMPNDTASTDSSQCRMDMETTPATPHTASRPRDASRGRRSMTQESSDMPISIHGDELSESIIVDDNGGEPIIIHSDDEMDDSNSCQSPQRRVSQNRMPPRSPEMVIGVSKEYKARCVANVTATWEKFRWQWRVIYARPDRKLHQILEQFDNELSDVVQYELWNEEYREDDGRRLHTCWVTYAIEKRVRGSRNRELVRRLGKTLQRLQEEEERASRHCAYYG
ncbi:hypothetical protein K458DRAFT_406838 [Lentithecium fluviatile CBS 122367]|uniref:Uncharacterized protein n=1 Tax=Lentithecium fluviatile CBS 122367 TaxID=1168545 RepID=A0A6G1IT98_9PLEO|nr:hypothetical protein K458DRAFT_406838 [Lentithecium fluviatile CBS 122367]